MAGQNSQVNVGAGKSTKRHWELHEDNVLASCMVDLYNMGSYNADTGFKVGYLNELERMMSEKLPNSGLKAQPHIISRIKTLKKEWSILYDMVYGQSTSGFGWDDNRKIVVADTHVWNAYLIARKEAAALRKKSFPHFTKLSIIYAKDHATGADAQSIDDIIEEVAAQEREEVDMRDDCFGMDPLDEGRREPDISMSSTGNSTGNSSANSSRQKRKRSNKGDDKMQEAITNALMMVGNELKGLGQNLKGIAIETQMQESSAKLEAVIAEVDGLTNSEKMLAHYKLCNNPSLMFAFLGISPMNRSSWLKVLLQSS